MPQDKKDDTEYNVNEAIFEIDETQLDREWIKQPMRFFEIAKQLAEAKLDLAEAKLALDVCEAEITAQVRDNPTRFKLVKITVEGIKNTVVAQPKYQKAVNRVNQIKLTVDLLDAAVSAMEHKKRALESLVQLHGQNYFSAPRQPEDTKETMSERIKQSVRSQASRKK